MSRHWIYCEIYIILIRDYQNKYICSSQSKNETDCFASHTRIEFCIKLMLNKKLCIIFALWRTYGSYFSKHKKNVEIRAVIFDFVNSFSSFLKELSSQTYSNGNARIQFNKCSRNKRGVSNALEANETAP